MSKVHFLKLEHRRIMSNEPLKDEGILNYYKELCKVHNEALHSQSLTQFSKPYKDVDYVIPSLEIKDSHFLCGLFTIRQNDIGETIREVNPNSQETYDIKPSVDSHKFEKFIYFIIDIKKEHLAFLYNQNAKTNTHMKITELLMHIFPEVCISTYNMIDKNFLDSISNKKLSICGVLKPEKVNHTKQLPSIKKLETLTGKPVSTSLSVSIGKFSPKDIKTLINISQSDFSEDYRNLKMIITDPETKEEEKFDLIEKALILKKELKLSSEESKDKEYVWSQLIQICKSL